jgi:type II secretion system protein G
MLFRKNEGFTLIELIMVIVILGILSAVAVPKFFDIGSTAKTNAAMSDLQTLRSAILGDPNSRVDGVLVDQGYYGHMGAMPATLSNLTTNPGATTFDKFTQTGWNGPYVTTETLTDPWDNAYQIDTTRVYSTGPPGGSAIELSLN